MATARPFQVDPILTAIAIGYRNPDISYVADRVLPRVNVASKFSWLEYATSEGFSFPNTRVGRKGRLNQVEFSAKEQTGEVIDYGLESPIPYRDQMEADQQKAAGLSSYDPARRATIGLVDNIKLDREMRVATLIQNLNTYSADKRITLSGGSQFSDYVNSDPIGVIKTAQNATFIARPNRMVIGRPAWSVFSSHPHIVNAIRGNTTGRGIVTPQEVAELFDLQEVIIGDAFNNTAKKGQAGIYGRVWGKHIALLHISSNTDPQGAPTFGFTGQWGTQVVKRKVDDDMGLYGGEVIKHGESVAEVISAKDCGYFIQNAVG